MTLAFEFIIYKRQIPLIFLLSWIVSVSGEFCGKINEVPVSAGDQVSLTHQKKKKNPHDLSVDN